jgi:hypothetical protein
MEHIKFGHGLGVFLAQLLIFLGLPRYFLFLYFIIIGVLSPGLGYWYGLSNKTTHQEAKVGAPPVPVNVVSNVVRHGTCREASGKS